ncbi:MAG: S41 family peptidase [Candidatus Eremiobacteraeota bacterium]|nr:S41 family peptidase [Candidatus Eremiobacteraeota bacterium]MBC5828512.1 S41 family peptidase [Candidatus Eremiobacteraeota bacterium]
MMLSVRRPYWIALCLAATLSGLGPTALVPSAALGAPDVNRSMVDYSFARASLEFYKQTGDQVLLDGAVAGLRAAVRQHGGDPEKIPALHQAPSADLDLASLNRDLALANKQFGATVGEKELTYAAIKGVMESLHDRWTVFLDPKEYKSLNEGLDGGNFPGVGVVIDVDPMTKALLVVQTIDGGPAQKAGIQPGDVVLTIDGKTTKGLTTADDSKMIRGPAGTSVQLTVQRPGTPGPLSFTITRATIHTPSIFARVLNGNVGYVRVVVFGLTTGQELSQALDRLDKAGVKGYILDLRNNGGGYLNAAIDVSSKFVPEGPIVSIDSRTKPLTTFDAENSAIAPRPLAVLVNEYTASASEITSGAIQDSHAGVLIGTKTFGKGVVQTIFPLPDGSAIKITTARYLTPSGRDINTVGIEPNIVVADTKPADMGNVALDSQLKRALSYVGGQIGNPVAAPAANGHR